jgi:hypothetical protein
VIYRTKKSGDFYRAPKFCCQKRSENVITDNVTSCRFQHYNSKLFSRDDFCSPIVTRRFVANDSFLHGDFTFGELNTAIAKLPYMEAPEPDAIVNEVWKALDTFQTFTLNE